MIDGDASAPTGRTTSTERFGRPTRATAKRPDPLAMRSEELIGFLKDVASKAKPGAVHHLRSTIRRVETLLPEPSAGEPTRAAKKLQKQLDRIRKRAGKVRDTDVHLEALATLAGGGDAEGVDEIRTALEKARDKYAKRLLRVLGDERDRGFVKRLRRVVGRAVATAAAPASSNDVLADVIDRFESTLAATEPLSAENLHQFRIQTKRLRYLAETAGGSHGELVVAALKRAQDAIGTWHDWLTLAERATRALDVDRPAPILAAIETRAEAELAKAIKATAAVGRRLLLLRPKARRKGVRPVTTTPAVVPRSAGASA
jgi:CHAD domain-containing protein